MAAEIRITVTSTAAGGGLGQTVKDLREVDTAARGGAGGLSFLASTAANALGGVLADAASRAGQAIVGFVGSSIGAAGDFQAAINGFQAVTGSALAEAGFDFDDVSRKALQLGQDTQYSAQEAITAMTELSKGGVPVVDVMGEATDATLALAAASGESLASSAEIVAKQLGVWAETGVGAQEVTDMLASAANASTVGVSDLALGLANAGGTAKVAGVEFGDLVQSMALIAPNFSSAADAGTSFKTFISRLIPTTGPAIEAMDKLGLMTFNTQKAMDFLRNEGIEPMGSDMQTLSTQLAQFAASQGMSATKMSEFVHSFDTSVFYDAQGNFVGMEQAARLLKDATADLSEEQRLQAFNTIFGSDAIRAAAAIAGAGAEGFNAMGESMAASGGAAATAQTMQQGYNFALEQAKGSFETLQIVIGTMLLPVLTDLMDNVVTPAINTITQFAQGFADAGDKGAFLRQKVAEVGAFLQSWFSETLPVWLDNLGQMGASLVQWVVDALPGLITSLLDARTALVNWVLESLPGWASQLAALGEKLFTWVVDALPELGTNLGKVAALLIEKTGEFIAETAPKLLELGGKFILWVADVLPKLPGEMAKLGGAILTAIGNFITEVAPELGKLAQQFLAWVQEDVLPTLPGKLAEIGAALSAGITGFIDAANAEAAKVGDAIISGIVSAIEAGVDAIIGAAKAAAQAALDAAKALLGIQSPSKVFAAQVGLPIVQGMAQGMIGAAPLAAGAGAAAAGAALGGASTTVSRSFTYAPTIYGGGASVVDAATARALARI